MGSIFIPRALYPAVIIKISQSHCFTSSHSRPSTLSAADAPKKSGLLLLTGFATAHFPPLGISPRPEDTGEKHADETYEDDKHPEHSHAVGRLDGHLVYLVQEIFLHLTVGRLRVLAPHIAGGDEDLLSYANLVPAYLLVLLLIVAETQAIPVAAGDSVFLGDDGALGIDPYL